MFHKNLTIFHDQILRYFQFPWFQSCASTSASSATENQPGESLKSKITFSLVSVGMVNHSFFIFFARFTIFIVKLDRQLIRKINRFSFSFQKQIVQNRNGTNMHAHNRCRIPNGRQGGGLTSLIHIFKLIDILHFYIT